MNFIWSRLGAGLFFKELPTSFYYKILFENQDFFTPLGYDYFRGFFQCEKPHEKYIFATRACTVHVPAKEQVAGIRILSPIVGHRDHTWIVGQAMDTFTPEPSCQPHFIYVFILCFAFVLNQSRVGFFCSFVSVLAERNWVYLREGHC